MTVLTSEKYNLDDNSHETKSFLSQETSRGSGRSITAENYENRRLSSTSSVIIQLSFEDSIKSKYQGLTDLIDKWLNEPDDYDFRIWPEIEKNIIQSKIKFRK